MYITASTNKMSKILSDSRKLKKTYSELSRKIMVRLNEFANADNLSQIPSDPPPRRHTLQGDREGQFAVDINGNYRIVFEGYDTTDQLSTVPSDIVSIQILSIEDYH